MDLVMETFDVFLSFKGVGECRSFMSHLNYSLSEQQIRTFKNDEDDKKGNEQAVRLIEKSKIAIPVISQNYTHSLSCLRELKKMIECKEKGSLVIVPVFYEVDPSDFVNKADTLADQLAQNHSSLADQPAQNHSSLADQPAQNHSKRKEFEEPQMLRRALVDLTYVFESYGDGAEDDAQMIRKVMDYITHHLRPSSRSKQKRMRRDSETIEPKSPSWNDLSTAKPIARPIEGSERSEEKLTSVETRLMERSVTVPGTRLDRYIGIEKRMKEVNQLLELDSRDGGVSEIIFWGMQGSGKTLLATCVYEHISSQFQEYYYYSVNIPNNNKYCSYYRTSTALPVLEEITRACLEKPMSQSNLIWNYVRLKLGHRKALLVVDGIDCIDQLKHITMVGRLFGPGSRLILVIQNQSLLMECQAKHRYHVKPLSYDEALQLLLQVTFNSEDIPEGFDEIFDRAVVAACRIPFTIKLLGSVLQGRPIKDWEAQVAKTEATQAKSFEQVCSRIKYPPPRPNRYYGKEEEEERHKFPCYDIV